MQQKQMMILVAVLAVVVIAIVAVVLLMGNKPAAGPVAPGTNPLGGGGLPPAGGGGLPPAGGGGLPPAGGGNPGADIASAMASGAPVECDMTYAPQDGSGMVMTMNMKMQAPKFRATVNSAGVQTTMVSMDGVTIYMTSPMMGEGWFKITSDNPSASQMDPNEIRANYANPPAGYTYNCRAVGSISNSEFAPPAGAEITDLADLAAAYGGAGAGGYPGV